MFIFFFSTIFQNISKTFTKTFTEKMSFWKLRVINGITGTEDTDFLHIIKAINEAYA